MSSWRGKQIYSCLSTILIFAFVCTIFNTDSQMGLLTCSQFKTVCQLLSITTNFRFGKLDSLETDLLSIPACSFFGDRFNCICDEKFCNHNKETVWNLILNSKIKGSEECHKKLLETAWKLINPWDSSNFTLPEHNSSVVLCRDSARNNGTQGDYCYADYSILPRTCYTDGISTLGTDNYENTCLKEKNVVRIVCHKNMCNENKEHLKLQIENGVPLIGGEHIQDCKQQLLLSLGATVPLTTPIPTTSAPTSTSTVTSTTSTTTDSPPKCPRDWVENVNQDGVITCYRLEVRDYCFNYYDAAEICKSKGAYMTTMKNKEEENAVLAAIAKSTNSDKTRVSSVWIGARDLKFDPSQPIGSWPKPDYHWEADNTTIGPFLLWGPGEPSQRYLEIYEACMTFRYSATTSTYFWNDISCNQHELYGCSDLPEPTKSVVCAKPASKTITTTVKTLAPGSKKGLNSFVNENEASPTHK